MIHFDTNKVHQVYYVHSNDPININYFSNQLKMAIFIAEVWIDWRFCCEEMQDSLRYFSQR